MDGMDVFIYFVVCISSLIKFIKQDDKYIYKFKCKKCQERREWNNLTYPVWVFCFDYIGCFVRVYQLVILNNIWNFYI